MIRLTRASLAGALILSVALVAACGGGGASTTPVPAGATPDSAGATPAPTVAAPDGGATPGASVGLAIPSFDIDDLVANLEGVDSYRVTVSINGEEQSSSIVVTKPVLSRDITLNANGSSSRIVLIGDEAWIGSGDMLSPAPKEMTTGMLSMLDPTLLVAGFSQPGLMQGSTEVGREEKNGVQTTHYRIDSSTFMGGLASLPPDASIDLWVADEGFLVALETTGIGQGDLVINVTEVNSPDNKVERPG